MLQEGGGCCGGGGVQLPGIGGGDTPGNPPPPGGSRRRPPARRRAGVVQAIESAARRNRADSNSPGYAISNGGAAAPNGSGNFCAIGSAGEVSPSGSSETRFAHRVRAVILPSVRLFTLSDGNPLLVPEHLVSHAVGEIHHPGLLELDHGGPVVIEPGEVTVDHAVVLAQLTKLLRRVDAARLNRIGIDHTLAVCFRGWIKEKEAMD